MIFKFQQMAGYSSNPLFKKLGLKDGHTVRLIHAPANYKELIGEEYDTLIITKKKAELDFIHLFTNRLEELETELPLLKDQIKKAGTIWISWYKKTAKLPTEINENLVREIALKNGLVDVKVCAVDEQWSGLKLVFRLSDR